MIMAANASKLKRINRIWYLYAPRMHTESKITGLSSYTSGLWRQPDRTNHMHMYYVTLPINKISQFCLFRQYISPPRVNW
jgi:hypothetical protein